MKKQSLLRSMGFLLAVSLSSVPAAWANEDVFADSDERAEAVVYGSCNFEGQFASGCMEFTDGTWTDASMLDVCQKNSKEGSVPSLLNTSCDKSSYNAACVKTEADGSKVSTYVNNMPAFICKKYLSGELTKRPATGW